jgi:hypothetical protein
MLTLPLPSKDVEPDTSPVSEIVRAVANVVAVSALPVTSPVKLPVKLPSKVAATNVSLPTVHLSSVSFHTSVLLAAVPRSISIPPFCVGVPVSLLLSTIWLSARLIVSVLTVVVVPDTVRFPDTVTSLNVTFDVVLTA